MGERNPLIKALEDMSVRERRQLLQDCMEMAMPWVEAKLDGADCVTGHPYMCIIGVNGADAFRQMFGSDSQPSFLSPEGGRESIPYLSKLRHRVN